MLDARTGRKRPITSSKPCGKPCLPCSLGRRIVTALEFTCDESRARAGRRYDVGATVSARVHPGMSSTRPTSRTTRSRTCCMCGCGCHFPCRTIRPNDRVERSGQTIGQNDRAERSGRTIGMGGAVEAADNAGIGVNWAREHHGYPLKSRLPKDACRSNLYPRVDLLSPNSGARGGRRSGLLLARGKADRWPEHSGAARSGVSGWPAPS